MDAAEVADSEYRVAVLGAATARADYELEYHRALAVAEGSSQAARDKYAEAVAYDAKRAHIIAEAGEKAAKVHVQVLLGLMVAAQSQQKFAGMQDGGNWNPKDDDSW